MNKYNKIYTSEYQFSVVNYLNNNLNIGNIFPHTDCRKTKHFKFTGIASVLYLFNKKNNYNGTTFYKPIEKITGNLLKIDGFNKSPRLIKKINYLKNILNNKCYNADEKEYFYKKILSIDAKYNRIVFYKTSIHHNADINKNFFFNKSQIKNSRYTITSKIMFINKVKLKYYDTDKTFLHKYNKKDRIYISEEKINLLNKYLKKYNKNIIIKVDRKYY